MDYYHQLETRHFLQQGRSWLESCENGDGSRALAYAALEFRYGIELLGLAYWNALLGRDRFSTAEASGLTYKKLESKIYKLAGHQREIDAHFEFQRTVNRILGIPGLLPTPNLPKLAGAWHICSETLHVTWAIDCQNSEIRLRALSRLREVGDLLEPLMGQATWLWSTAIDKDYAALKTAFVKGRATVKDVEAYARRIGLRGELVDSTGKVFAIATIEDAPPSEPKVTRA